MEQRSRCLLCGARMTPAEILGACSGLVDVAHGVLGASCPYCQGYFEVRVTSGAMDLGYRDDESGFCFQTAQSMAFDGLTLSLRENEPVLILTVENQRWTFSETGVD